MMLSFFWAFRLLSLCPVPSSVRPTECILIAGEDHDYPPIATCSDSRVFHRCRRCLCWPRPVLDLETGPSPSPVAGRWSAGPPSPPRFAFRPLSRRRPSSRRRPWCWRRRWPNRSCALGLRPGDQRTTRRGRPKPGTKNLHCSISSSVGDSKTIYTALEPCGSRLKAKIKHHFKMHLLIDARSFHMVDFDSPPPRWRSTCRSPRPRSIIFPPKPRFKHFPFETS